MRLIPQKLSKSDINRIIDCLNSQHYYVRKAATECLIKTKERLLEIHVVKLVDFLKNRDYDTSINTLVVPI